MKKLAFCALLALSILSLASQIRAGHESNSILVSRDIPPPDCAPDCQ